MVNNSSNSRSLKRKIGEKFSPLAVRLFSAIFSSFDCYKAKSPTVWPRIYLLYELL